MRARSSALRTPRRTRRCASCMAVSVREAAFRYEPAPLFKVAKGARRGNRKGGRGRPARLARAARSAGSNQRAFPGLVPGRRTRDALRGIPCVGRLGSALLLVLLAAFL